MKAINSYWHIGALLSTAVLALVCIYAAWGAPDAPSGPNIGQPPAQLQPVEGIETIVIFRHGEKPAAGLGQLTPQGFNRALALSQVLPQKFGKPDYLFAPDPHEKVKDRGGEFFYIRPLATIEPLAIRLGMNVQTPFGFTEISKLDQELSDPKYSNKLLFVAWEHVYARKAAVELVKIFHGDTTNIPDWPGKDYDSLYVVKIHRASGAPPTATFTLEHEGLDGQSTAMPVPAAK